ncbi:hypothetical protein GCM10009721_23760 [Terrabacter tumescens]|uniref:DUF3027 domain-containing protein n=1 Tax=Terrabacter tumescens TaxID=60443 RepID=A0ABQ2HZU2_9MICO|nr:DUF3027 domain-containing protein [Terrabacter tumescens]GGM96394.1 hypothetical protein GCM10009721_23760 [Terrabacter tumescens]
MTVTAPKTDAVLLAASDLARSVLEEVAEPGTIGAHLGMDLLEERLGMHWFECTSPGYRGWRWGVSVARVPRAKVATVCETNLLPGPDAVLAPEWLPYADRLAPGDLGAGDVLPFRPDDPNLEAGFEATGEEEVDQMAFFELGLGRPRVLSAEGREAAATRWYSGDNGPTSEVAAKATEHCSTCGYFLPMAGALRVTFGVCANEWSPSDGRVVTLDHGCGAHSETDMDHPEPMPVGEPIVDEFAVDVEPAERPAQRDQDESPTATTDMASDDTTDDTTDGATDEAQDASPGETPAEDQPAEEQHGSDDPVTD